MDGWVVVVAVVGGTALLWLLALVALAVARPRGNLLTEAIRLLPDLLRLISRLARDAALPRRVRVRLWLLVAYLALPIDLVPDFVPVLGYADDAIVVALVLRSVVRGAGPQALERHWPGTPDGLAAVRRLAGLPATQAGGDQTPNAAG
ncbi:YkvA family protein [Nonomuraea glycinis]|uniref:YkvA family protein n=1 Tax=Nonomuraea glycinis TaxID=2047744 RepID=UPI0033A250B2